MSRLLCLFVLGVFALAGCAVPSSSAAGHSASGVPQPTVPAVSAGAPADILQADFAPTGRILFVKGGVICQWREGSTKALVGDGRYEGPSFSPDGSRFVATTLGDNHSDLLVFDSSGKRLNQLTDNWSKTRVQDSAWARHPAWSPDDTRIAYASDAAGAEMALWTVDVGSGNRRRVFPAPNLNGVDWPAWSPDSKELALTVFDANGSQIVLVNISLGPVKNLTQREESAYDPAWSPDGEHIAFAAHTSNRSDIWMMDSDGSHLVRLTDIGSARSPAWSPGGDLIAFIADQGQGFDLYAMKPSLGSPALVPTSELKRLTSGQGLDAPSGLSWAR